MSTAHNQLITVLDRVPSKTYSDKYGFAGSYGKTTKTLHMDASNTMKREDNVTGPLTVFPNCYVNGIGWIQLHFGRLMSAKAEHSIGQLERSTCRSAPSQ